MITLTFQVSCEESLDKVKTFSLALDTMLTNVVDSSCQEELKTMDAEFTKYGPKFEEIDAELAKIQKFWDENPPKWLVANENQLGCIYQYAPDTFYIFGISTARGGYHSADPLVNTRAVGRQDVLRPATEEDFRFFRVSSFGIFPNDEVSL